MYDVIIVGAGPAGLTSAVYASCYHLTYIVIGKVLGGQMASAMDILNYPGFVETTGKELTYRMIEQVKARGGSIQEESVTYITKINEGFELTTENKNKYQSKTIILATGTERRKLQVKGENEYSGKGVLYCATCERQDYDGKVVAVVGGGNSAAQSAIQLAQAASKVFVLHRGAEFRADPVWMEQIQKHPNIELLFNTTISEIVGNLQTVTGLELQSNSSQKHLAIDKVFIEIGGVPGTALIAPLGVTMDSGGFIQVDSHLATNVAGIYAAGDLVSYGLSIEQISSAVGLGARAAASVFSYLKGGKKPTSWGTSIIQR